MFGKKKVQLDMIETTSKVSLKMSCLRACGNDVERAERLYAFLSADLVELPDFDPVTPSGFEVVKSNVMDIFDWINGHKEDIAQGVSLLKSIGKTTPKLVEDIPPIPKV